MDTPAHATAEGVEEPITAYDSNADIAYLGRAGQIWSLGPITPDMDGSFADDAAAWNDGTWEPNTGDGQTLTSADGLTPIAEWTSAGGVRKLDGFDRAGAAATYVGASGPVVWSVVEGASPDSTAVEPGVAGVDVPPEVITWAESHGLHIDKPDIYLLVTPEDEAGEVAGEVAFLRGDLPVRDIATIRKALAEKADPDA